MSNHCEKRMTPIDIFSDLHMHSRYSDGTGTIEQMARDVIKKHNEKNRYFDETNPWGNIFTGHKAWSNS